MQSSAVGGEGRSRRRHSSSRRSSLKTSRRVPLSIDASSLTLSQPFPNLPAQVLPLNSHRLHKLSASISAPGLGVASRCLTWSFLRARGCCCSSNSVEQNWCLRRPTRTLWLIINWSRVKSYKQVGPASQVLVQRNCHRCPCRSASPPPSLRNRQILETLDRSYENLICFSRIFAQLEPVSTRNRKSAAGNSHKFIECK